MTTDLLFGDEKIREKALAYRPSIKARRSLRSELSRGEALGEPPSAAPVSRTDLGTTHKKSSSDGRSSDGCEAAAFHKLHA